MKDGSCEAEGVVLLVLWQSHDAHCSLPNNLNTQLYIIILQLFIIIIIIIIIIIFDHNLPRQLYYDLHILSLIYWLESNALMEILIL